MIHSCIPGTVCKRNRTSIRFRPRYSNIHTYHRLQCPSRHSNYLTHTHTESLCLTDIHCNNHTGHRQNTVPKVQPLTAAGSYCPMAGNVVYIYLPTPHPIDSTRGHESIQCVPSFAGGSPQNPFLRNMKHLVGLLLVLLLLGTVHSNTTSTCCEGSMVGATDNLLAPDACPTPSELTVDSQWHTIAEVNCTMGAPTCVHVTCMYAKGMVRLFVLMQGCYASTEAVLEELATAYPDFTCVATVNHTHVPVNTPFATDENVSVSTPTPTPTSTPASATVGAGTRGRPSYMAVVLLVVLHSIVVWI